MPDPSRTKTDSISHMIELTVEDLAALRRYRDLRLATCANITFAERDVHVAAYSVIDRMLEPQYARERVAVERQGRLNGLLNELAQADARRDLEACRLILVEILDLGARYEHGKGYVL